ncbi:MAG: serine protease AprX [Chloroflexota bacterium]|jgi:serine protease AprX|nr:serine protease AprX [Chloroflexota bacterium]
MASIASRSALVLALVATLVAGVPASAALGASPTGDASVTVIVRADKGSTRSTAAAVRRLGGSVRQQVAILNGFVAAVPERAVAQLRSVKGVRSVTRDMRVNLSSTGPDGTDAGNLGALTSVANMIGADDFWRAGYTGAGVDVALIDSGVAPVDGLNVAGKVFHGPDLSFESQSPSLAHLDTYGHGTHMGSILAGNDTGAGMPGKPALDANQTVDYVGIAPGARLVSVKVADAWGTTDVSQVIVAIDWVIAHRNDDKAALNIRVLNLSFGTNGTQTYTLDPLAYAVEQAWKKGIFVVVSAGNEGYGTAKLNDPAYDPFIMAVGATEPNGTVAIGDDTVAAFSSGGDATRHPDLVAPGTSILGLRDPGSYIDTQFPSARVGDTPRLFRGSGTSQATAVVSGAAALVLQQRPNIKPDQLKKLLTSTAVGLSGPRPTADGSGEINLAAALTTATPSASSSQQKYPKALGLGSLEGSRGSFHLVDNGVQLTGNRDIFGKKIDLGDWLEAAADGDAFDNNGRWLGTAWTGRSWTGNAWDGRSWTSGTWAGRSWTSDAWTGRSWTGRSWTGGEWTGRSWTTGEWTGNVWSGSIWE